MPLSCPKCHASMESVTFHDITVDRCTLCKGLWFDLMEHRHLRDLKGAASIDTAVSDRATEMNRITKINCPVCKAHMTHLRDVDDRSIEYEYCSVCNGVFFDAGEFAHYQEHTFPGILRAWFTKVR